MRWNLDALKLGSFPNWEYETLYPGMPSEAESVQCSESGCHEYETRRSSSGKKRV